MADLNVSANLRKRVNAAWDASHPIEVPDEEFWQQVVQHDAVMAEVWMAVRREVRPDANSVLGKLVAFSVDGDYYPGEFDLPPAVD